MMTVRRAEREDACTCAALGLQMSLEAGQNNRQGFLAENADYFLAHFEQLPTWLAVESDGTALGYIQTSLVFRSPTLAESERTQMVVTALFVTPAVRGHGLASRMVRSADSWAALHQVQRCESSDVSHAKGRHP